MLQLPSITPHNEKVGTAVPNVQGGKLRLRGCCVSVFVFDLPKFTQQDKQQN